jgi:hypothetical protein
VKWRKIEISICLALMLFSTIEKLIILHNHIFCWRLSFKFTQRCSWGFYHSGLRWHWAIGCYFSRYNVLALSSMLEISKKDIWPFITFKMKLTPFLEMSGIDYPENGNHFSFLYGKLYLGVRCLTSIFEVLCFESRPKKRLPRRGFVAFSPPPILSHFHYTVL